MIEVEIEPIRKHHAKCIPKDSLEKKEAFRKIKLGTVKVASLFRILAFSPPKKFGEWKKFHFKD
ncbi:hypothetical protein [Scopulibacillus cellulosilyticus]|uniref:Uncharacterized protein n=1 Tax=Scopulibacillus cellulosilyticus TaxID=2665665 RepID=A0ABW2Q2S9_9BACL